MRVSLNWLVKHVSLEGLDAGVIADYLTQAGVEVEGVEKLGVTSPKVVVAQVCEAIPHANADRLKVCQVDAGEGKHRQIVCGAKNYRVGDKVPCALPGSELPGGWMIGETTMRGVPSHGMLCAAEEIGLPKGEDGLLILPDALSPGQVLCEVFPSDTVLDVEVTPNRPDLLSHYGMARELAAITGSRLQGLEAPEPLVTDAGDAVRMEASQCPFYSIRRISGVKVTQSPEWLCERLTSIGLRPINNIVDVTNYVLHETGQPLHAFDAAKVTGAICVRQGKPGEEFSALDGQCYQLAETDCVISDASGAALALGGVMGGEGSDVNEDTVDIVLESAWFEPTAIRGTSRRLLLSTDSSYRFERRVDPAMVLRASQMAVNLILELAGGQAEPETLKAGVLPCKEEKLVLVHSFLHQMTAGCITPTEGEEMLARLGLKKEADTADGSEWLIPSYRPDLSRPVDLLEEVVRMVGYDRITPRNMAYFSPTGQEDLFYDKVCELKERLSALGFYECKTIKLISRAQLADCLPLKPLGEQDVVALSLPLSEDHTVMRPSLAPGLIATAVRNANHGASRLAFYEHGTCFRHYGGGKAPNREEQSFGLFLAGEVAPTNWATEKRQADLYDLRAVLEHLLPGLDCKLKSAELAPFVLGAHVMFSGVRCGVIGRLSPARSRELGLPKESWGVELDLQKLVELASRPRKASALPLFPGSSRDASLELPKELPNADVEKALAGFKEPLLVDALLFNIFCDPEGVKMPADRKSLAYRFHYRSPERTLRSEEVDAVHQNLLQHLKAKLPLVLR